MLAITLQYLATLTTYKSPCTSLEFIGPLFLRLFKRFVAPSSPQEWKAIADEGYRRWNFPNCFGAADRKHIAILKKKYSRSDCNSFIGIRGL